MNTPQQTWDAENYAKNSSAQLHWAQVFLASLMFEGDETLLDIGCGDGKITAQLSRLVPRGSVLGIDASEDMIHFASTSFPKEQYPNLRFQQMDAATLDLPRQFDVVISNAALHWIESPQAVLKGVQACLKPGGQFRAQMSGRGNAAQLFAVANQVMAFPTWRSYFADFVFPFHLYGSEEYHQWLVEHGFCPIRVELIPRISSYNCSTDLRNWLQPVWFPFSNYLPPALRSPFLEEIVDLYARNPSVIDDHGKIILHSVRLEVEASLN